MKNLISIFEIPSADFSRAVNFYKAILDISIEEVDMGTVRMGVLAGEEGAVSGAVIHGADYKPSSNGVIIYLNGGDDLQVVLNRVEANKGKILVPKTEISPEMGYYALFLDTEGNKLGVHSSH